MTKLDYGKLLERARKYCASQERAESEVRGKLRQWRVPADWQQQIMETLWEENFLNEERFTRFYVRDKFLTKKWGRLKIQAGLRHKKIPEKSIEQALAQIPEEEYLQSMKALMAKKNELIKDSDPLKRKQKLVRFILSRGFEPELVWGEVGEFD